jgi:hypothetical protein
MKRPASGLKPIKQILRNFDWDRDRFVSREFQLYGYKLAEELGDLAHKSMYIKFAKEVPRELMESARNFVKGASNARSRARLFMWKLKELRKGKGV